MIWVEILSRHRDVAARFHIAGDEAHIGRGYDNDVIIDDPYVAARHLRVFRDESGRLIADDAGSKNGLFLDRDSTRRTRVIIEPECPIRIGHTYVRIRDATYAVPLERLTGARTQTWPALIAAGLGVALLAVEVLFVWMMQTGEPRASAYLTTLLFVAGAALAWVSVWTVLSRIFSGQGRFAQNLLIALSGFLLISLFREFAQIAAFAFTWPAAVNYEYVMQWCIVAVACFLHLRETGQSRLVLKGAVIATLLVLAISVQTVLRSEALSDFGGQSAVRRLMPPAFRLAPVRDESDFFAEIERLKAGLDRDRNQAQVDAGR